MPCALASASMMIRTFLGSPSWKRAASNSCRPIVTGLLSEGGLINRIPQPLSGDEAFLFDLISVRHVLERDAKHCRFLRQNEYSAPRLRKRQHRLRRTVGQ